MLNFAMDLDYLDDYQLKEVAGTVHWRSCEGEGGGWDRTLAIM